MSRHTPGPWSKTNIWEMLIRGSSFASDTENMEADATLMAAAPDMLDALKWAQNQIDTHDGFDYLAGVIAKAEGKDK